jgi:hypothetical protein
MNADIEAKIDRHTALVNEVAALEREIFTDIAAQPGYHQVRFSSGDTWSNGLLHHTETAVINGELKKHVHVITSAQ